MSHIGVWKKFVASGAPLCVIFEDDVVLSEVQLHQVNEILPNLPRDCGVWILGCYLPNLIIQPIGESKWSEVHKYTAAHAYILTRDAAKKLLEEPYPVEMHIEYYITAAASMKEFKILHHADVHLEFFRKERGPRTVESNTSQHKKSGCPSCDFPDDYKQLYRGFTRKTKNGTRIAGVIDGEQPKDILTYENTAKRENSRYP
jgi:GR25 family glycosyltransferase involved in LPS biosynthesis